VAVSRPETRPSAGLAASSLDAEDQERSTVHWRRKMTVTGTAVETAVLKA
jgi:hypothetical protein